MSRPRERFGYIWAEIVPHEDREGVDCHVWADRASASLAVLQDFGCLSPDEPHEEAVDQETIDEITAWAEEHGY